jgi:hypothetical protein
MSNKKWFEIDPLYSLEVSVVAAASTAADSAVWNIRLDPAATKPLIVRRIYLADSGLTTATQGNARYYLQRFSAANMSGGSALALAKLYNNAATIAPTVSASQHTAALTVTSVVFETPKLFVFGGQQTGTASKVVHDIDLTDTPIIIQPGEGICIRLLSAIAAGSNLEITGSVILQQT